MSETAATISPLSPQDQVMGHLMGVIHGRAIACAAELRYRRCTCRWSPRIRRNRKPDRRTARQSVPSVTRAGIYRRFPRDLSWGI